MRPIFILIALVAITACASSADKISQTTLIENCYAGRVVMIGPDIEQQLQLLPREYAYLLESRQSGLLLSLRGKSEERIMLCGRVTKGLLDAEVLNVERVVKLPQ